VLDGLLDRRAGPAAAVGEIVYLAFFDNGPANHPLPNQPAGTGVTNPSNFGFSVPGSGGNSTNLCAGVDPRKLDYKTLRFYGSEGKWLSPRQHITEGHINRPPNDPRNSVYITGSTVTGVNDPLATWAQVVDFNRATFGVQGTVQGNKNIKFQLTFPKITVPGTGVTRLGIGQTPAGKWLNTNVLVVDQTCTGVVTSFPTEP